MRGFFCDGDFRMQHFHMSYMFIPSLFISCIFSFLASWEEDCVYGTVSSSDTDLWWRHQRTMSICVPYVKRNRKEREWRTEGWKDEWKLRDRHKNKSVRLLGCWHDFATDLIVSGGSTRAIWLPLPQCGGLSRHHFITPSQVPLYPPSCKQT